MKKSKAFSLIEVIVSVFILFLVLISSIKLNSQQLKTYSIIREKQKELHFFKSLNNYLKSKSISNSHLEFNNYSDFINSFSDFQSYIRDIQNKDFNLLIDIEDIEVNFSDRKEKISLISLEFKGTSKTYKNKIIKFKD